MLRALVFVALASCSAAPPPEPRLTEGTVDSPADPHHVFWEDLRALCGRAFEGVVAADVGGGSAPDPFAGKVLRMHVRECSDVEIRVPLHVGDDRSRTWVFTRLPAGLRLEHDHRHEDGSPDSLTMYGGHTLDRAAGGPRFPADERSRDLFIRENRAVSVSNVWIVELVPGERFSYSLTRPGREFRVDFDLTKVAPVPPPPWGTK